MRKMTAEIVLGDQTYTIHAFTIGELEQIAAMQAEIGVGSGSLKFGFDLIRMALKRAEPAVDDPNTIEAGFEEVRAASATILELAGLVQTEPGNPQKAAA